MGAVFVILSFLAVPVMGAVGLITACILGSMGQPANQLFGWFMIITTVPLTVVMGVAGMGILEQRSAQLVEKATIFYLLASLVLTISAGLNVLLASTPSPLAGWVPFMNGLLFVAAFVTIAFGDKLEQRWKTTRVAA